MANITQGQISTALSIALQLDQQVEALINFCQNANTLIQNNFSYPVPGSADLVTLTPQQQTDMLAGYTALKQTIQTTFLTLP